MSTDLAIRPEAGSPVPFRLESEFRPAGDQPQAIAEITAGLDHGERDQVLLGRNDSWVCDGWALRPANAVTGIRTWYKTQGEYKINYTDPRPHQMTQGLPKMVGATLEALSTP